MSESIEQCLLECTQSPQQYCWFVTFLMNLHFIFCLKVSGDGNRPIALKYIAINIKWDSHFGQILCLCWDCYMLAQKHVKSSHCVKTTSIFSNLTHSLQAIENSCAHTLLPFWCITLVRTTVAWNHVMGGSDTALCGREMSQHLPFRCAIQVWIRVQLVSG